MFLLIDKPKRITSHDVIDDLRKTTGIKKIGHAGTLDPNATGLLVVGIGRESTKRLGDLTTKTKKTYVAEIVLGEERDTDDVEGNIRPAKYESKKNVERSKVESVVGSFVGKQKQIPPAHSAIKIKGRKAYQLARKGKKVELKKRNVEVFRAELLGFEYPLMKVEFVVSSGTYVRALARDIGRKLGTGAYLGNLRRTKIGKFDIKDSIKLTDLTNSNWESNAVQLDQ